MRITITTWVCSLALGALVLAACTPPPPAYRGNPTPPVPKPPTPVSMDNTLAFGLWTSNFGAVKIEANPDGGSDAVMGVWLYDRSGQEVIGYFAGDMRGNVLQFNWHEPGEPTPLTGSGYISFQTDGKGFSGRWWSHDRRRNGLFSGKRDQVTDATPPSPSGESVDAAVPESQPDIL